MDDMDKGGNSMKNHFLFEVPADKKIRVIIDTDAACEADDPFAIVQALLSPKLIVRGIVAAHFNEPGSTYKSYKEIEFIRTALKTDVPIFMGQEDSCDICGKISDGVRFIIDEALSDDNRPLFILCQGAVTDLSVAFRSCPEIINRVTVIWIGTHGEAPCKASFREYNAGNDVLAANLVLSSGTDLWVVPSSVYRTVTIGLAEIQRRIRPCGEIGNHLFEQMVEYNMSERAGWTLGESWSLGDSPAVALALNPDCGHFRYVHAPFIDTDTSSIEQNDHPMIRMYSDIDTRYILEDLIAKLEFFSGKAGSDK